jgi:hypothetical protein
MPADHNQHSAFALGRIVAVLRRIERSHRVAHGMPRGSLVAAVERQGASQPMVDRVGTVLRQTAHMIAWAEAHRPAHAEELAHWFRQYGRSCRGPGLPPASSANDEHVYTAGRLGC